MRLLHKKLVRFIYAPRAYIVIGNTEKKWGLFVIT